MDYLIALIAENGSFIGISLISFFTAFSLRKKAQGVQGSGLVVAGFLLYGLYGLLAFTGPGFNGSFFRDFSKVAMLNSQTLIYFLGVASRIGMVFIFAGIYQMARSQKTS